MTDRNDVDALAARADSLAAEVRTKTAELETARALLDEAQELGMSVTQMTTEPSDPHERYEIMGDMSSSL